MFQSIQNRPIGFVERAKLYSVAKGELDLVQRLKLDRRLEVHNGCVNTICWNDHGHLILSGSDDQTLVVSDPFTAKKIFSIRSGHRANIFSAKFLPNSQDKQIVSCSGDGKIFFTEVEREDNYGINLFDCHFGTTYEVITVPNEVSTFLSCGEDGTVRWFDLRMKTSCHKENCKEDVLINCRRAVTSLAVNPLLPYELAIACSDSTVRIYDRRMLGTRATGNYMGKSSSGQICRFTAPTLADRSYRITSLGYSPDGSDVLVSYSSEYIYLFGTKNLGEVKPLKKVERPDISRPFERDVSSFENISTGQSKDESSPTAAVAQTAEKVETAPVEIVETAPVEIVETGQTESTQQAEEDSSIDINADPSRQPPIKRLRLRGDWSDTGPNARPESERQHEEGEEGRRSPHTTIMQRMSDMLTRWLDGNLNRDSPEQTSTTEADPEPGASSGADNQTKYSQSCELSGADNQIENLNIAGTSGAGNVIGKFSMTATGTDSLADSQIEQSSASGTSGADNSASKTSDTDNRESSKTSCEKELRLTGSSEKVGNPAASSARSSDVSEMKLEVVPPEQDSSTEMGDSSDQPRSECVSDNSSTVPCLDSNSRTSEKEGQFVSLNVKECVPAPVISISSVSSSVLLDESCGQTNGSERLEESDDSSSNLASDSIVTVNSDVSNNVNSLSNSPDRSDSSIPSDSPSPAHPAPPQGRLEPVISLHYSTEGTTSSTVHLGFATFENLEAGVLQRSAEDASLNPLVSGSAQETSSCTSKNDRSRTATSVIENTSNRQVVSSCQMEGHMLVKNRTKDCDMSDNSGDLRGDELSYNESGALQERVEECCADMTYTAEKVSCRSSTEQTSQAESSSGQASESKCKNIHLGADNSHTAPMTPYPGIYSRQEASVSGEGSGETNTNQSSSSVSSTAASTRQRRIGRSGPPTGEYQLTLEDPDSSDEDIPPVRAPREERTIERRTAAIRLQRIYRKRQEEKEREREERETKSIHQPAIKIKFKGHRNTRTMIKESSFWGSDFVMSGSDCGHIFVWDRNTAQLVMLLEGDRHVVNCLQPHPYDPVLASSGIDYDIKLWAPLEEQPNFDEERATEIMRRNEIMLDETRDTITVPAAFMLRVLASLNQIRSGRSSQSQENQEDQESSSDSD